MKSKHDIICVGSATVDVFAKTESELIKIKTRNSEEDLIAYPVGSKILVRELEFQIGGGGTNTAVSFSHLGFRTGYLGNIGNDENSRKILSLLKKEGIDFLGSMRGMAGYSVILDSIEEDRTILAYKGANDDFQRKDVKPALLDSGWMYCSSMMGKSFETLKHVAQLAKRKKMKLAFNPSSYQAKMGAKALKPIFSSTTALILNREEAGLLLGKTNASPKELVRGLHSLGIPYVCVTDGKNGAYASDRKRILFAKPLKVKVVETTGAGDGFASAFVSGLMLGKHLDACLRMGMLQAESVVTHMGAKAHLMTMAEMNRAMKKDKRKIQKI